jgi:murein DD-endopeptidase MepM/ murein hydrolase activator NlpD
MRRESVGLFETFGLLPLENAIEDAKKAILGKGKIPPTKFDLSSIKIFKPWISLPTWLGITRNDRRIPIYNFYNRARPPEDDAFSVRVSYARDFMDGSYCYDSHMGTDFAIPVGTRIVTCAPGKVVSIANHLDHGGLKIFIDHGAGLITSYAHLSRALVADGEIVGRGRPIALSGAAGIELILLFPWISPHLHLNTILNGNPVDPFAKKGETSLWKNANDPAPHSGPEDCVFSPTVWNEKLIENAISECGDPDERDYLRSIQDIEKRAIATIDYRMFYNTLFSSFPPVYDEDYERRPILDLPFSTEDYDGVLFP